jgi:hypothetical protein
MQKMDATEDGRSLMHFAASAKGGDEDFVDYLLGHGCVPWLTSRQGEHPFHAAVRAGNSVAVASLLNSHASSTSTLQQPTSPLKKHRGGLLPRRIARKRCTECGALLSVLFHCNKKICYQLINFIFCRHYRLNVLFFLLSPFVQTLLTSKTYESDELAAMNKEYQRRLGLSASTDPGYKVPVDDGCEDSFQASNCDRDMSIVSDACLQ